MRRRRAASHRRSHTQIIKGLKVQQLARCPPMDPPPFSRPVFASFLLASTPGTEEKVTEKEREENENIGNMYRSLSLPSSQTCLPKFYFLLFFLLSVREIRERLPAAQMSRAKKEKWTKKIDIRARSSETRVKWQFGLRRSAGVDSLFSTGRRNVSGSGS